MRTLAMCAVACSLSACSVDTAWERRVASVEAMLARAEVAGAMRCAPRELALGRAHLGFAKFEIERGQRSRAEEHVAMAEPNAGAALYLSSAPHCPERPRPIPAPAPRASEPVVDPEPVPDPVPPVDEPRAGHHDGGVPHGEGTSDSSLSTDLDMDGVPNASDECPLVAGEAGASCPHSYEGFVVRSERILLLRALQLDLEGQPLEATRPVLRALARAVADRPGMHIEIGVHTDSEGTEIANLTESQRLAERLRELLLAEGAEPARVRARGYGEEFPLESNSTPEGRAANRRVEIRRMEAAVGGL